MRIAVLGAGVVGVTTAWYLAADGHEVTVVERQSAAAMETSFANGGQISVSHAEPWANPSALGLALRWLGREDAPLLWRWRADADQWRWGLRFLRECSASRARANLIAIVRLGLASRAALQTLRHALQLEYAQLERGILHFYTDPAEFEKALPQAVLMREAGCDRQPLTASQCLDIEPALAGSAIPLVGGTYTAGDESGDAHRFTLALAGHAGEQGVAFRYGETIAALEHDGMRIGGVRLASGEVIRADATVVALGAHSPRLLRPCGIRLPVYPAKGYSATIPVADGVCAPTVSLTDDGHRIVFSRLGQCLRVAGTAEFAGYDMSLNPARCQALVRRAGQLFPALEPAMQDERTSFWTGLRPSTPGNVPLIGSLAAHGLSGLWVNTGHGTLGWTLACGSARLLTDLVAGRAPEVDPAPYRPGDG